MKTIGLIGGMSWESTVTYYQILNTVVAERLGGLHSAKCLLYSVDFQEIEEYQAQGEWEKSGTVLAAAASTLADAGAELIVLCTNTMHKIAPQITAGLSVPFLHIAECTAQVLLEQHITNVGLLGTNYTMTQDFYKAKLVERGITVQIPNENDRGEIHRVIYEELCHGIIHERSRNTYLRVVNTLAAQGAQGIILGCTEIGLLINQADTSVPLFDTAQIHATTAALMALGE